MDLPTIVEAHKMLDNKVLYKAGDIAQMIVCSPEDSAEGGGEGGPVNINEMTAAKKKELYKKFLSNHGSELVVGVAEDQVHDICT